MSSELVKSTNSLPFLKESEKDYWNKLLDSNIRAGTMACMWCMKAQLVKKTSLAFHRWKFVVARQSWYGNSSPSKNQILDSSGPSSTSHPHSAEKTLNHAGARPISAVLAHAISLMNQLKETDAERDVNTRLFASPSASVKAANAAATSVLEFDSKSLADLPKTASASGPVVPPGSGAASGFPWERRRRAGSHSSMEPEYGVNEGGGAVGEYKAGYEAPAGEDQSTEVLAAYNRQRLAYVLRSILPDGAAGAGGNNSIDQSYAMNLDGTRRVGSNNNNNNSDLSPGFQGEEELTAYLRNALLSQNHDAATRGQILMALSQNMANKSSTQRINNNNKHLSGQHQGGHGDITNDNDLEVSSRSSLSLLKISGSNPPHANASTTFPRARANSRTGSPNARLSRKSLDTHTISASGGGSSVHGNNVQGGNVQGSVYHEYNYDSRPYYADTNANTYNNAHYPETPDAYHSGGVHGRTYPSSASSLHHGGGSVSGHSLHSDNSYHTTNSNYNHYSSNTSINTSTKKPRAVPGYLMPTNSFRKKQSSASGGSKSSGSGNGRARSPGMITSSTSKHAAVLGSGGGSPTAYTVKGSVSSGGRSGSSGRGGDRGSGSVVSDGGNNVFYASASTSAGNNNRRATTPNHSHHSANQSNPNSNTHTTNNTNNANSNSTSYANMSFLDYQARKANLHTTGHRSPVRRNSANIDTSRIANRGGSVYGEDETDQSFPPASTSLPLPLPQAQVPPLALPPPPLAAPVPQQHTSLPLPLPLPLQGVQPSLPLTLSEPALPPSLRSQTHTPRQDDPTTTNSTNTTNPELVYEQYDTYHNSTLHSNSNDLYEHNLQHNTTTNTNSSSDEYAHEPHSPTEHILYNDHADTAYYNHAHNTHSTHNTHAAHAAHHSQPFVADASNTLRPAPATTNTSSSGKRSNPNSGGKNKPKGMDKAQLELIMYGDVHGRAPNWHKTLRN